MSRDGVNFRETDRSTKLLKDWVGPDRPPLPVPTGEVRGDAQTELQEVLGVTGVVAELGQGLRG